MRVKKFFRICPNPESNPNCKLKLGYTTQKEKNKAEHKGNRCSSCRAIGHVMPQSAKKVCSDKAKIRFSVPGNHPWQGRKHTAESCQKMTNSRMGKVASEETRKKMSRTRTGRKWKMSAEGRKNVQQAHCKWKGVPLSVETKAKLSMRFSGKNNPMYGTKGELSPNYGRELSEETKSRISIANRKRIPVSNSSGGIGGWYKGKHFRSSCELNFLLQNKKQKWKSAESDKFAIPYVDSKGRSRIYYPDWFDEESVQLVEVKPFGWEIYQKEAKLKAEAAKRFCEANGWVYHLVEIDVISKKEVFQLRKKGTISLDVVWEQKFQKWELNQHA
jgi:hypothetical protein